MQICETGLRNFSSDHSCVFHFLLSLNSNKLAAAYFQTYIRYPSAQVHLRGVETVFERENFWFHCVVRLRQRLTEWLTAVLTRDADPAFNRNTSHVPFDRKLDDDLVAYFNYPMVHVHKKNSSTCLSSSFASSSVYTKIFEET